MKCEAHYYKKVSELMCFFNEYVPWVEEAHLQVTRYKAHLQVTRYKAHFQVTRYKAFTLDGWF
jgi:hypothetical protein